MIDRATLAQAVTLDRFTSPDGAPLNSLLAINQLPVDCRDAIYRTLLYDKLLARFNIDLITLRNPLGEAVVVIDASPRIAARALRPRGFSSSCLPWQSASPPSIPATISSICSWP